jgi:hypothetical protein
MPPPPRDVASPLSLKNKAAAVGTSYTSPMVANNYATNESFKHRKNYSKNFINSLGNSLGGPNSTSGHNYTSTRRSREERKKMTS